MKRTYLLAGAMSLALSACSGGETNESAAGAEEVAAIPESLAPFGDGYPTAGAPCRQLGESAATSNYLDDSALLIGCPSDETASMLGGMVVGNVEGIRLVSVPMGDSNAGMPEGPPMQSPVEQTAAAMPREVAIRGANGLEGRCAKKVASEVGARVTGTNRIEESEAAIAIYFNVEGAEAPWRCLAYRDGTVGEVMYTGSEGAM